MQNKNVDQLGECDKLCAEENVIFNIFNLIFK